MLVSEFKRVLQNIEHLQFALPNGAQVPAHFHITEAGLSTKHFIDCGGTVRLEKKATIQLWYSKDVDHRLSAGKLVGILNKAEVLFLGEDLEIDIEYQGETVGRYGLAFENGAFYLQPTFTDCLAKDNCGIPGAAEMVSAGGMFEIASSGGGCCTPGGGCC